MKFAPLAAATLALVLPAFAQSQQSVTYDTTYDDSAFSLTGVACSDGVNGLINKGYTTLGSLPSFPYVGGAFAVAHYNSPNCGTCWKLYYAETGKTINVLAVDVALDGFNISEEAMNKLTGGLAVELGRVEVTATQVPASVCGL